MTYLQIIKKVRESCITWRECSNTGSFAGNGRWSWLLFQLSKKTMNRYRTPPPALPTQATVWLGGELIQDEEYTAQ